MSANNASNANNTNSRMIVASSYRYLIAYRPLSQHIPPPSYSFDSIQHDYYTHAYETMIH